MSVLNFSACICIHYQQSCKKENYYEPYEGLLYWPYHMLCLICLMIKCMQVSTSKIVITWVLTNICMEFLKYWWLCVWTEQSMCVMYSKMTNLKFTPIEKTLNWPAWDKASYTIHYKGFRFENKSSEKLSWSLKSFSILDLHFYIQNWYHGN